SSSSMFRICSVACALLEGLRRGEPRDHSFAALDLVADFHGHFTVERHVNLRAGAETDHAETVPDAQGIPDFCPRHDAPCNGACDLTHHQRGSLSLEGPCHS